MANAKLDLAGIGRSDDLHDAPRWRWRLLFTGALITRLKPMRRLGRWLQIAAGAGMILMGVAMITGWLSTFAFWLLKTFPAFSAIG